MTIERIKLALAAATPGEWKDNDGVIYGLLNEPDSDESYPVCDVACDPVTAVNEQDMHNAEFITLAHNLMPVLLEAVATLEAIKARFEGNFDHPSLVAQGTLHTSAIDDMYGLAARTLNNIDTLTMPATAH